MVFFDSEESLRAGDQMLNEMSPPDELSSMRRTGVEKYEVAMEDLGGEIQAARASRLAGPADRVEEGIAFVQENVLPKAQQLDGWQGYTYLVDRAHRKGAP